MSLHGKAAMLFAEDCSEDCACKCKRKGRSVLNSGMAGCGTESPFGAPGLPKIADHEVVRCIGRGSYGEVWLGRSILGTYRAIKVVRRSSFEDERPFEREFSGIQKFEPVARRSQGLVHILQIGRNDEEGYFYYVMELADDCLAGEQGHEIDPEKYAPCTLGYKKSVCGKLPASECLALGLSLVSALEELHGSGLIHRDVKPSNIVFVKGAPKLADIGLVADASQARSYVGTEGFIPPEGPNSAQADIYSLGKVLYELAMGKDRQDFPEPASDLKESPDRKLLIELNAVILKACEPDPSRRYKTASAMAAELRLLQGGRSVRQKRVAEQRRKVTAIALAAGTAIVAIFLGIETLLEWRVRSMQGESSGLRADLIGKVPPRPTTAPLNTIDLSAFYNAPLIAAWYPGPEQNTLAELPSGIQMLAGTTFDIRGLVQLTGNEIRSYGAKNYPRSVSSIPIGRWVTRLHFLHGAISEVSEHQKIGSYHLLFQSGKTIELPIRYGDDVRALWQPMETTGEASNAEVAWTGNNPPSRARNIALRLYKQSWENPTPEDEVIDVAFVSQEANSAPFLIALTCEEQPGARGEVGYPQHLTSTLQSKAGQFQKFPLPVATTGAVEFAQLSFNQKPMEISGSYYDGFRFTTPTGESRDLLWGYVGGTNLHLRGWYILPVDGGIKVGFEDWYHGIVTSVAGRHPDLTLQYLPARKLEPNREYFIWFQLSDSSRVDLTAALRFVPPGSANGNLPETISRALGLNDVMTNGLINYHRHYCLGSVR